MSDERKKRALSREQLFEALDRQTFVNEWKAKVQIRQIIEAYFDVVIVDVINKMGDKIQQKPEVDDMKKYVIDKACEASRFYSVSCKTVKDSQDFITQIISDAQGKKHNA
jgi:hypothetical protein